ncbi:MAG: type VI secretion system accessory protein TagJ [Rhodocyclaceae bacterium]
MTPDTSQPSSVSRQIPLADRIAQVSDLIRKHPLVADHRRALAHLRVTTNEHTRALQQLQAASQLDPLLAPEAQLVRMLTRAEQMRSAVFDGKILPDVVASAPEWMEQLLAALRASDTEAATLREQALASAPACAGRLDEDAFEWLADGDERLGPVFELIFGGSYYWVPMDAVSHITMAAPSQLLDLVWAPVTVVLKGHAARSAFMPARYPLRSEDQPDDGLLLGDRTEWLESSAGCWIGRGRRTWHADGEPVAMFQAQRIDFGPDEARST